MRIIVGLLTLILIAPVLSAASDEEERIANGAEVLQEILNIPDGLPKDLLNKAECVVVLPSVKKFAFGVGEVMARDAGLPYGGNFTGPWELPQCIVWREPASDSSWEAGHRLPSSVMNPKGSRVSAEEQSEAGCRRGSRRRPKGRDHVG
jgi:hypothetical protein